MVEMAGREETSNSASPPVDIQIWSADPRRVALGRFEAVLDQGERDRADRYRFAEDRRAFIFAHGLRRFVMAEVLHASPASLRFGRTAKGRPLLVDPDPRGWVFSVARRRSLATVACAQLPELGVDVEALTSFPDPGKVLEPYCDAATRDWLAAQSPGDHQDRFARLWTAVEACAKARGTGLADFTPRLSVRFDGMERARVIDGDREWACMFQTPDDGHRIAVAHRLGLNTALTPRSLALFAAGG